MAWRSLAQAPSKHWVLTSYTSCHSYLFYKHHTPSVNCMAATTDFTPDTFTQVTCWGIQHRLKAKKGFSSWVIKEIFLNNFLFKCWIKQHLEEHEMWVIAALWACHIRDDTHQHWARGHEDHGQPGAEHTHPRQVEVAILPSLQTDRYFGTHIPAIRPVF